MDLREYALSLGRDIPERYLDDIEEMADRKVVLQYCKRFPKIEVKKPVAKAKPVPKVKPKQEEE
tara:strand:- start:431 stop:622 length:192 start_codon:yes stop_codon:yes gene_type:complete